MKVNTHIGDSEISLDALFDEFLPDEKLRHGVVCSDMDQTMFKQDIGQLVFLEQLSDPGFWSNIPKHLFPHILMPLRYRRILERTASGTILSEKVLDCRYALYLEQKILDLQGHIRKLISRGKKLDLNHPVVNEFMGKMLALDSVIMRLQPYLSTRISIEELFMRTRFFAGWTKETVVKYTSRAMARDSDATHRRVTLRVHNKDELPKLGSNLEPRVIYRIKQDRLIEVVAGVREILARCFEKGAHIRIVTTNLSAIAEEALRSSEYIFLDANVAVLGSSLRRRQRKKSKPPYRYKTRFTAPPFFARRKAEIAQTVSGTQKRVFLMALGDSPSNDGPMGEVALRNGGVFVMVGNEIEKTRRKFDPLFRKLYGEGEPEVGRRMVYVKNTDGLNH